MESIILSKDRTCEPDLNLNLNLNYNISQNISVQFRVDRNPVLVSEDHVVSYFILLLKISLFKIQAAGKWTATLRVSSLLFLCRVQKHLKFRKQDGLHQRAFRDHVVQCFHLTRMATWRRMICEDDTVSVEAELDLGPVVTLWHFCVYVFLRWLK